jgi:hypothetical protein
MACNDNFDRRYSTAFTAGAIVIFSITVAVCGSNAAALFSDDGYSVSAYHADHMPVSEPTPVIQLVPKRYGERVFLPQPHRSAQPRNWQLSFRARALHRC